MHTSTPGSSLLPRLPGRTRRQRLTVAGITLAICAVFWAAIYTAHRDIEPLLYERLVPVTIVPTPPAAGADVEPPPTARKPRPGAAGRSASSAATR